MNMDIRRPCLDLGFCFGSQSVVYYEIGDNGYVVVCGGDIIAFK